MAYSHAKRPDVRLRHYPYVLQFNEIDLYFLHIFIKFSHRGWSPKFATGLNIINRHSSKSIKVTKLSFCQNDPPKSTSF